MKALKELRLKKNLCQKDIAEFLKISRTTYSKWETGAAEPNISALIKLADYFNVTVDYLIAHEPKVKSDKPKALKIVDNTIIYRYNGKTIKKSFTDEEMRLLSAMLNSIGLTDEN